MNEVGLKEYILICHKEKPNSGINKQYLGLCNYGEFSKDAILYRGYKIDIVSYHWNDRIKFNNDCIYVNEVYERVFHRFFEKLNSYHNERHSERYWRIIIGPWLYPTVALLYDRWEMCDKANTEYKIKYAEITSTNYVDILKDDFYSISSTDKKYNAFIYSEIIKFRNDIKWEIVKEDMTPLSQGKSIEKIKVNVIVSRRIKAILFFVNRFISKLLRQNYFIYGSCMNFNSWLKLNFLLRQFPIRFIPPFYSLNDISHKNRDDLYSAYDTINFESFVEQILPKIVPKAYVEGYRKLKNISKNLGWPDNPKSIFTAISYNFDELFKIWAASKVETGTRYIIGQHGGNLGLAYNTPAEIHYAKTSDLFFTWGWKNKYLNTVKGCAFKLIGEKNIKCFKRGELLLLSTVIANRSYKMISMPIGFDQSNDYINQQQEIITMLNPEISSFMFIRVDGTLEKRLGVSYSNILKKKFPSININYSDSPLKDRLLKSRLILVNYNGTVFLETLALNYPTVIFLDPQLWELREQGVLDMGDLSEVNIFHSTPESAASHINTIWNDVSGWWNEKGTQRARYAFCSKYANLSSSSLSELKDILSFT
jgi:putative transferase (TIGR04331 family)